MGLYSEFVFVDEAYFGKTSEVKKDRTGYSRC